MFEFTARHSLDAMKSFASYWVLGAGWWWWQRPRRSSHVQKMCSHCSRWGQSPKVRRPSEKRQKANNLRIIFSFRHHHHHHHRGVGWFMMVWRRGCSVESHTHSVETSYSTPLHYSAIAFHPTFFSPGATRVAIVWISVQAIPHRTAADQGWAITVKKWIHLAKLKLRSTVVPFNREGGIAFLCAFGKLLYAIHMSRYISSMCSYYGWWTSYRIIDSKLTTNIQ